MRLDPVHERLRPGRLGVKEGRVRQRGGICGVIEAAIDQAAMVAIVVGTASMVGGVSSAIASVCM